MSKPQTVELYTTDGDLVIYRPLAARLPEFLARFGPERGFAVRTEIADLLSFRPGLLRLCEVAAREGRKAEDLGLPPLAQAAGLMVCRAALEDANGRVLATATAAKEVRAHKDLEALETAARQRLLAAVGIGGELLEDDERRDWADGDLREAPPDGPVPVEPVEPVEPETAAPRPDSVEPVEPPEPETADGESAASAAPSDLLAARGRAAPPAATGDRALALLRQQIAAHARQLGIEPPPATTVEEARAALKALIQRRQP